MNYTIVVSNKAPAPVLIPSGLENFVNSNGGFVLSSLEEAIFMASSLVRWSACKTKVGGANLILRSQS